MKYLSLVIVAVWVIGSYSSSLSAASPLTDEDVVVRDAVSLQAALDSAAPGTRIMLAPGRYTGAFRVTRSGSSGRPIVISGVSGSRNSTLLSVIDGKREKVASGGSPCFNVENVEWITFENLDVRGCWPNFIRAEDSRYITLRDSRVIDSRVVFYATGATSHHFAIERNTWIQDPTHALWNVYSWEDLHHGKRAFYNGALFGSKDILGDVRFHGNHITYAYNGIRMVADPALVGKRNLNVDIANNYFSHIRDNPIEPEGTAVNWWVHHNRFYNGYALFSFTQVDARDIYVFGNTGWFTERLCSNRHDPDHCVGKIFKFEAEGPYPSGSIYVFHNSWYTASPLVAGGRSRNFHHFNNAIFFDRSMTKFFETPEWDPSYRFDGDLANIPFDPLMRNNQQEKSGIVANPLFKDARMGRFEIPPASPAVDAGKVIHIAGWTSEFEGRGPDVGAYEGSNLFRGPAFQRDASVVGDDFVW